MTKEKRALRIEQKRKLDHKAAKTNPWASIDKSETAKARANASTQAATADVTAFSLFFRPCCFLPTPCCC